MSNVRAVFVTVFQKFRLIGHLEYASKSNTEFQNCFMSLRVIS